MKLVASTGLFKSNESADDHKNRVARERKTKWQGMVMSGQYLRQVQPQQTPMSCNWLTRGELKRETEGTILAAQEQALRTNYVKNKIDRSSNNPKCRICKEKDETINHVISECPGLAQREYKRRHDKVARTLHWNISRAFGFECNERWYQHEPELVLENERAKIL